LNHATKLTVAWFNVTLQMKNPLPKGESAAPLQNGPAGRREAPGDTGFFRAGCKNRSAAAQGLSKVRKNR
jgi:hypothetical protein